MEIIGHNCACHPANVAVLLHKRHKNNNRFQGWQAASLIKKIQIVRKNSIRALHCRFHRCGYDVPPQRQNKNPAVADTACPYTAGWSP